MYIVLPCQRESTKGVQVYFDKPLEPAVLEKRYKRFFADAVLESTGESIVAHCPNTGSMRSCGEPGDKIWVQPNDNPKRKLKYTWELSKSPQGLVHVNTGKSNQIVMEAFKAGQVEELKEFTQVRAEVPYADGKSRCDLLLYNNTYDSERNPTNLWLEIKSVTLLNQGSFSFPDAITSRGLKHVEELTAMRLAGVKTGFFFLVNRTEPLSLKFDDSIDKKFYKALKKAQEAGVLFLAYQVKASPEEVSLSHRVSLEL